MTMTWDGVLGGLERELEAVEAALAAGGHEVVIGDLAVPDGLGPLPDEARPRAEALQIRMADAERGLARAAQRARQAMVLSDSSPAPSSSFLDTYH
jgi:hypothetical protein